MIINYRYFLMTIFLILCMTMPNLHCRRTVTSSEVVGIFTVKYPYGIEQLNVMPDGNYEQWFAFSGQPLNCINKGKWDVERGDFWDGFLLNMHDPVTVDNGFGKPSQMKKVSGVRMIRIRKGFLGGVYLLINEDLGFKFKQI